MAGRCRRVPLLPPIARDGAIHQGVTTVHVRRPDRAAGRVSWARVNAPDDT